MNIKGYYKLLSGWRGKMELDQIKLDKILGEYFCKQYIIDINENYKIEEIDAKELIVPERIDLIAKLKYIEYRENGWDLDFIKEIYTAHIEAFSNGSYTEPGNDSKNSINKYFNVFNYLIDNIKHSGLDNQISVIPVGKNNVILDGAHRVAIAAYFNLKVPIIRFDNLYADFGVEFFRNRLLKLEYINYLVMEYCKLKNNLYFVCTWPGLEENSLIKSNQKNEWKVIYRNKVKISYEGLQNLLNRIDSNLDWKDEDNDGDNYLTIYLLECDYFSKISELKASIQDNSKHFIYITNNQKETIKLANILLIQYSVDLLNRGNSTTYSELQSWTKRKVRNIKHNSRRKLVLLTKKIGMYRELRVFYRYLKEIVK
jgi:hypothetical protein